MSVWNGKYRGRACFFRAGSLRQKLTSDIQSVLLGAYFPSAFLHRYQLMRRCWADTPDTRPTFTELCQDLEDWMQREIPYLDMDQLNEDQPYYDASAVSVSSGSSCEGHV